jgi:N-acetylglucosaminyldiphosphoundecaprenol N-acetyl-beta-D-mannosaminyltransferase
LFAVLFERLRPGLDRPFFVPSSKAIGDRLAQDLVARGFEPTAVAYNSPPHGFELDLDRGDRMVAEIQAHETTHLFMGVGAPKSERWVAQHLQVLPPAHIFCVGAALDFTAGAKTRAPAWLGQFGLEWLHRLLSEPSRLLPRYAADAAVLAKVLAGRKLAQVSPPVAEITPKQSLQV